MRRLTVLVAIVGLVLAFAAPQVLAAGPPPKKDNDTYVQLLAINDFHGNLAATAGNTIQTGCCNAVLNGSGTQTGWAQQTVLAGGVEYLSTYIKSLRVTSANTITVGAGDLIGASPLVSGLFHDEPTIEAMNIIGLDVSGVGNHEFDEGANELLRMQYGGCHPVDGCQDGDPFGGSFFQYLASNVFYAGTNHTILPPYEIRKIGNAKIAFLGLTLEGTPSIVTPSGVAGLEFRPEVETINALVQKLRNEQGVRAFVVLLHQGGSQAPPSQPAYPAPANPDAYTDVNKCVNFNGPELTAIVNGLDPQVDVVISAHTHQPYICNIAGKVVTSASSFGRVITDIDLVIDHQTKDVKSVEALNRIVKRDVAPDPAETALLAKYTDLSNPLARQVVGSITADITSQRTSGGENTAGESALGDVIADAQLEATAPTDFGGSKIAFMNPGGIRTSLLFANTYGIEAAGVIVYGELFESQPFGNSLVVKTCTGGQIQALLEQQQMPATGSKRVLQVSNGFTYTWDAAGSAGSKIVAGSVKLNNVSLDPFASYRVTMNSFLATGGDGFTVFNACTDALGGEIDLDALVRYFQNHSPVAPGPKNRITRLN